MKAAKRSDLEILHSYLTKYLTNLIRNASSDEDAIPLDAATMGMIAKFLKDNEVFCAPEDIASLDELRKRYASKSKSSDVQSGMLNSILEESKNIELLN